MNLREVKVGLMMKHVGRVPLATYHLLTWSFANRLCLLCLVQSVTEEAEPRECGETKGGDQGERPPLLCL